MNLNEIKQILNKICDKYNYTSGEIIDNVDVIIDTLDELRIIYNVKFSNWLINLESIKMESFLNAISKEIDDNDMSRRFNQVHKYLIIYAKLIENKATKEIIIDGPYFGDVTDNQDEATIIAKNITERQQNNVLIKIYERSGRSDTEIMNQAKKYFEKIQKGY